MKNSFPKKMGILPKVEHLPNLIMPKFFVVNVNTFDLFVDLSVKKNLLIRLEGS